MKVFKEAGNGRVLVIDGGGISSVALLGATMVAEAVRNGWAGAIVNGAIRDVDLLATTGLPVKALGTVQRKSPSAQPHERDVPLTFGGVTFEAGDWVYADGDGILVRGDAYVPTAKAAGGIY